MNNKRYKKCRHCGKAIRKCYVSYPPYVKCMAKGYIHLRSELHECLFKGKFHKRVYAQP